MSFRQQRKFRGKIFYLHSHTMKFLKDSIVIFNAYVS
jgi:hypothetical protein